MPLDHDVAAARDVLQALEYGTRKEETDLLDGVLLDLSLTRARASKLARSIVEGPGFESFLLSVLKAIRPFALMLQDVYAFLNAHATTASMRASMFRVSSDRAKASLDFDLSNFPRELVRTIVEASQLVQVTELRLPGTGPADPIEWHSSAAEKAWQRVNPIVDGPEFYDDGFHRALSYAHTVLPSHDAVAWTEARRIAEPVLDRLTALVEAAAALDSASPCPALAEPLGEAAPRVPRACAVPSDHAGHVLCRIVGPNDHCSDHTVLGHLRHIFNGMEQSVDAWRDGRRRDDRHEWLEKRLGTPLAAVRPDSYLALLEGFAEQYRAALDDVAPIVADYRVNVVQERLTEFLSLPFWKQRWYLYELWTVTVVLGTATEDYAVRLEGVRELAPGHLDWRLPGGSAKLPVAFIGAEPPHLGTPRVSCWVQRKTFHPVTKAGLEPDLRLTSAKPEHHDLLIVENKDRLTGSTSYYREILERYAGGTCASRVWLINYATFSTPIHELERSWPDDRVRIASRFVPRGDEVDQLQAEVRDLLRRELGVAGPSAVTSSSPLLLPSLMRVTLTWGATPRDLDLHAWVYRTAPQASNARGGRATTRAQPPQHVSHRDRGSLELPVGVLLDADLRAGHGPEVLTVATLGMTDLVVAVHNYSADGDLSGSGATLSVELGGTVLTLTVPTEGTGRWWHALRIRAAAIAAIARIDENSPVAVD